MFSFLESVVKVALAPVDLAVGVVADTVTLGGLTTDKDSTYTGDAAKRLVDNVKDTFK